MKPSASKPLPPATIAMTFHGEGIYARKSLLGVQRIREYSAANSNEVRLICILDCAEDTTAQLVKNYLSEFGSPNDKIIETRFGSLSAARNTAADHAQTEFLGFLDGDDFFSANWVEEALKTQMAAKHETILCLPEKVISFGSHISAQTIQPGKAIPLAQMMNLHYWVSSSFAHINTYRKHPYNENINKNTRFVFEDWDFNLRCIAAGISIVPVENTYLFYRRRENSMLAEHVAYNSLIPPSDYFAKVTL